MLTRLYVDNYKSLVNFEFRPPRLCVLIGENGSGKSAIGSVLAGISKLIIGRMRAEEAFPSATLCRWSESDRQVVELEHEVAHGHFSYRLELLHERALRKVSIASETLQLDGTTVYEAISGKVAVVGATLAPAAFSFDPSLSFLAHLDDNTARVTLRGFRELIRGVVSLKPDPLRMSALATAEDQGLSFDASNFSAWYRWLIQARPQLIDDYFASLTVAIPGFRSLSLTQVSVGAKLLTAMFDTATEPVGLTLDELSDGQRQLMLLYLLLHDFEQGHVLFLDEPDNFISIREVQPWLSELERVLDERKGQAIIVSHGTEAMNYLGSRNAFVVTRPGGGPTRIARHDGSDGSMPSEVVLYGNGSEAGASK